MEIMKLFFTPDEQLQDKKITDFFDDEVFSSNFWLYWRTMFAFENWHSALEMKLYLKRYIHHIGGLPDFTALRFTRYNQYESIILPMVTYLKDHGVQFHYDDQGHGRPVSTSTAAKSRPAASTVEHEGQQSRTIDLTENDLLFITNGGCVEKLHHRRSGQGRGLRSRPSSRATAGICGRRSPRRTPPSAIPKSSAHDAGAVQLGKRHHHHAGRQDPAVYPEDLQA